MNVSLSLASQHARSFHCNLCGSVDDSGLTTHLVFSSLLEDRREPETTNIASDPTPLCSDIRCCIYGCFHMDERNGRLLCDAIVSADGPLKSFPPLLSCASAGMHLSFLASLVRFHSCLSSRSPIVVRHTSGFFVKLNWLSHASHFFPTLTFLLIQASWKGSGLPPPLTTHLSVTRHMGTSFNSLTQVATQTRGQTLHPQRPQERSVDTPHSVCLLPLGGGWAWPGLDRERLHRPYIQSLTCIR